MASGVTKCYKKYEGIVGYLGNEIGERKDILEIVHFVMDRKGYLFVGVELWAEEFIPFVLFLLESEIIHLFPHIIVLFFLIVFPVSNKIILISLSKIGLSIKVLSIGTAIRGTRKILNHLNRLSISEIIRS